MVPPYMVCPFITQYQDGMYNPQLMGIQGHQYFQPIAATSCYCPVQASYVIPEGIYSDAGGYETDPRQGRQPILSDNPATINITLFKELTAYPNYGNPSRNADILYTGNSGSWTFQLPAFLLIPGNLRGELIIRAVLDDHSSVPVNRYSARITINGNVVHNGRLSLEHGRPEGGIFNNWRELRFNVANLRRINWVTIVNTSNTSENDWIAFDWMELRLLPR